MAPLIVAVGGFLAGKNPVGVGAKLAAKGHVGAGQHFVEQAREGGVAHELGQLQPAGLEGGGRGVAQRGVQGVAQVVAQAVGGGALAQVHGPAAESQVEAQHGGAVLNAGVDVGLVAQAKAFLIGEVERVGTGQHPRGHGLAAPVVVSAERVEPGRGRERHPGVEHAPVVEDAGVAVALAVVEGRLAVGQQEGVFPRFHRREHGPGVQVAGVGGGGGEAALVHLAGQVQEAALAQLQALVQAQAGVVAEAGAVQAVVQQHVAAVVVAFQGEVHHARNGVGAVLGGGAVAQNFHPVHRVGRNRVQVGGRTAQAAAAQQVYQGRRMAAAAVHEHQHLVHAQAAQAEAVHVVGAVGRVFAVRVEGRHHVVQQLGVVGARGGQGQLTHVDYVHWRDGIGAAAVGAAGAHGHHVGQHGQRQTHGLAGFQKHVTDDLRAKTRLHDLQGVGAACQQGAQLEMPLHVGGGGATDARGQVQGHERGPQQRAALLA